VKDRPSKALVIVSAYSFPHLSSRVDVRVVFRRLAGPDEPGVHEKVQENEFPCDSMTVSDVLLIVRIGRFTPSGRNRGCLYRCYLEVLDESDVSFQRRQDDVGDLVTELGHAYALAWVAVALIGIPFGYRDSITSGMVD